jgi:hypothetical protein
VLPITATTLTRSIALTSIDIVNVVAVEIVVVVDRYVTAAVPIAIAPATSPSCANSNASSEREQSIARRIHVRIRIRRRTVNHTRAVLGYVNNLRIRWFDHNHLFVIDGLGFDRLLRARV